MSFLKFYDFLENERKLLLWFNIPNRTYCITFSIVTEMEALWNREIMVFLIWIEFIEFDFSGLYFTENDGIDFFVHYTQRSVGKVAHSSVSFLKTGRKMVVTNGDHQHLSDDEDEIAVDAEELLIFQDDSHATQLLFSLNTMRKNKTFCDVILHVSILFVVSLVTR